MLVFIWLALVILFVAFEAVSLDLTSIWFAFGAIISMIFAANDASFQIQLASFIIGSTLFIIFFKPIVKKYLFKEVVKTNIDRLIGQEAVVLSAINEFSGEVRVDGKIWSARCNNQVNEGQKVSILEIKGNKLIVEQI